MILHEFNDQLTTVTAATGLLSIVAAAGKPVRIHYASYTTSLGTNEQIECYFAQENSAFTFDDTETGFGLSPGADALTPSVTVKSNQSAAGSLLGNHEVGKEQGSSVGGWRFDRPKGAELWIPSGETWIMYLATASPSSHTGNIVCILESTFG